MAGEVRGVGTRACDPQRDKDRDNCGEVRGGPGGEVHWGPSGEDRGKGGLWSFLAGKRDKYFKANLSQ